MIELKLVERLEEYLTGTTYSIAPTIQAAKKDLKLLTDEMIKRMNYEKGVGLAANQIGEQAPIFVAKIRRQDRVFIAPHDVLLSGKVVENLEGCLSIPRKEYKASRHTIVSFKYFDLKGRQKMAKFEGEEAFVIQHELDHLNNLLINRFEEKTK